jgi:hypothetical protein
MTTSPKTQVEIVSEAHGPHWVAWATHGGDRKPLGSVVLVGQTQEEAEGRARRWAERRSDQQ